MSPPPHCCTARDKTSDGHRAQPKDQVIGRPPVYAAAVHNDDLRSDADIAFDYGQLVELRWKYVRRKGLEWDRPLSHCDMKNIFAEDLYGWFMDERPQDPPSWHNQQKLHSIFYVWQRDFFGNQRAIRDILQQPCCWQTWNKIQARQTIMCKKMKSNI